MLKMLIYHYRQLSFENRRQWTKCEAPEPWGTSVLHKGWSFEASRAFVFPEAIMGNSTIIYPELSIASPISIRYITLFSFWWLIIVTDKYVSECTFPIITYSYGACFVLYPIFLMELLRGIATNIFRWERWGIISIALYYIPNISKCTAFCLSSRMLMPKVLIQRCFFFFFLYSFIVIIRLIMIFILPLVIFHIAWQFLVKELWSFAASSKWY